MSGIADETLEPRVGAGMRLLAATAPGWMERIALDPFDPARCGRRVLGQWLLGIRFGFDRLEHTPGTQANP